MKIKQAQRLEVLILAYAMMERVGGSLTESTQK